MEFTRRGRATAVADGDVSDGRRFLDPAPHGYSALVIREALQAQLEKERLRQEILEAKLAEIDRAMALRPASLGCISLADWQQGKPVSSVTEFMPRCGYLGAVQYPNKQDERNGSSELKPWKYDKRYHPSECSSDGKAGLESKLQESNGIKQLMPHSPTWDWELTEVTLPVKQPKAPERWSCTVCQVEATSEHNLQEHLVGQKHQSKVLSLNRNNGGRHLTTTHALQQEQSTAMDYVHSGSPSAGGKLLLSGTDGRNVASSEMSRDMTSLYFCKDLKSPFGMDSESA
nr:unnamed protein product [Digitaria exilis]